VISKDQIITWYQKAVHESHADYELKAALRTHERIPKFIESMYMEFNKIIQQRQKQCKKPLRLETFSSHVKDLTLLFIKGIKHQAITTAEKYRLENQKQKIKDLEEVDSGNVSKGNQFNEILEQGVHIGTTKEETFKGDINGKKEA
jgi:hypothetical protein